MNFAWSLSHREKGNEMLVAQKENIFVSDDWTAVFSNPTLVVTFFNETLFVMGYELEFHLGPKIRSSVATPFL